MAQHFPAAQRLTWIVFAALLACTTAWSDARIQDGTAGPERICYCDCDSKSGAPACMHMCELAKYENRSWAASCHKKPDVDAQEPVSLPRSSKNNNVQQASR